MKVILNNHAHLEPGALDDLAALMADEAGEPQPGVASRADGTAQLYKRCETLAGAQYLFSQRTSTFPK